MSFDSISRQHEEEKVNFVVIPRIDKRCVNFTVNVDFQMKCDLT